jgi:transposase
VRAADLGGVITLPAGARVLLASQPVDFRKGAHALAALASELLSADPFSGVVLVFRAKRADRIKIVLWDGSGLVLIAKQLEGGAFRWPSIIDGAVRLTPVEFAALFDGIDWTRVQSAKRTPTPSVLA